MKFRFKMFLTASFYQFRYYIFSCMSNAVEYSYWPIGIFLGKGAHPQRDSILDL